MIAIITKIRNNNLLCETETTYTNNINQIQTA